MEDNKKMTNEKVGKDPVVTAVSLIVIAVQSVIIILGFIYRWDWLAYECAAMLIIPAAIVLFYGVKAVIDADADDGRHQGIGGREGKRRAI